jgi:hypothetical protein
MKYSEFNYAKELLQNEVPKPNKIKLVLDRLTLFMGELTDLLFQDGQFVKPKTIQILRWWKIAQRTIEFIGDVIKILGA